MLRKLLLSLFVLSCGLTAPAANWKTEITMLVVPREPLLVQIAQDISRRYPVLIVCYQQDDNQLSIHAWNGKGWIAISEEDYTRGEFFKMAPVHTVIVEKEKGAAPDLLVPAWCDNGNRVATTDPRAVIHLLGRYFDFSYSHWMQFSRRYDYELEAINPALINVFWFHFRGKDILPALEKRDYKADMDKWLYLDSTPALQPEPIEVEEPMPEEKPEAEKALENAPPAAELPEDLFEIEEPAVVPPVEAPQKTAKTFQLVVEKPAEKEPAAELEKPVETTADEAVDEPMGVLEIPTAPEEDPEILKTVPVIPPAKANPFSTNEIPAAKIILPGQ